MNKKRTPDFQTENIELYCGDCLEVLPELEAGSIDTVCTDPPYGLEFMGKEWDRLAGDWGRAGDTTPWKIRPKGGTDPFQADRPRYHAGPKAQMWHQQWAEALMPVLKPGAMLMAFGGTRTYHRLTCAIEDAGFEIRDCLMWLYGSGFPKSHDISKAIDKAAGAEREVVGQKVRGDVEKAKSSGVTMAAAHANRNNQDIFGYGTENLTTPATDLAKQWDGWGTALKPAWEPIVVAMKPLDGTFAANAEKHGVAGLWIDGGRIGTGDNLSGGAYAENKKDDGEWGTMHRFTGKKYKQPQGRWPANLILSHHPECVQVGVRKVKSGMHGEASGGFNPTGETLYGKGNAKADVSGGYADADGLEEVEVWDCHPECPVRLLDEQSGERGMHGAGVARQGQGTKSGKNRSMFCGDHAGNSTRVGDTGTASRFFYCAKAGRKERTADGKVENKHPTVKPLAVMQYLVRLTRTPTGGTVLDPFMGSGTTALACIKEDRKFIGIEKDRESFDTAVKRIEAMIKRQEARLF